MDHPSDQWVIFLNVLVISPFDFKFKTHFKIIMVRGKSILRCKCQWLLKLAEEKFKLPMIDVCYTTRSEALTNGTYLLCLELIDQRIRH